MPAAAFSQKSEDCLVCHSDATLTMQKSGRTVRLFVDAARTQNSVHASMDCIDCHQGLDPAELPHAKVIQPVDCLTCHEVTGFDRSIHAKSSGMAAAKKPARPAAACKDCHGTHEILAPGDPESPANRTHISSTCGRCHENAEAHFARSAHGLALEQGVKGAPTCVDCHGEHKVDPIRSVESPVYKTHEAQVCLNCHLNNPDVRDRIGPSAGFIESYATSVHGIALASGNEKAATCSDCHGAHDMKKASDATSYVSKWNIPDTCAKCHADISKVYKESVHGTALEWGNTDAPSCTDCHGEHQIFGPKDPRSRVAPKNVSAIVCADCHNSVELSQKYGMPSERFQTFSDSYHGLASRAGSVEVANCASCHGVHNIKSSSDPGSMIHKANLAETCGQCHPGASDNFAKGSVHVVPAESSEAILFWVRALYLWIIVGVIGGMFIHNVLDFVKKSRQKFAVRAGLTAPHHFGSTQYIRMTLGERLQHAALFSSFIVLVVTGFMLKYPDSWWVLPIRQLSERAFEVRGIAHRVAGVVIIAASFLHIYYLAFVPRGRQMLRDMIPKIKDATDALRNVLYNAGLSKARPLFHRFGYIEKAEYWALIWGMAVMSVTGFILWFDNYFMNRLTKLGWDIARAIHFYEAVLATLAIVVWHFYYVIFNPNVYPMNTAWWNGKVTEEEMAEEHPLELEEIRSEQLKEAERLEDPAAVEQDKDQPVE
jgi:cytochrome b subunit of formate dehydrogenase